MNQTLGSATDYSSGFAKGSFAPDGLLGMAFQSISNYQSAPLFQNLVEQGQAEQAMFAFKLTETDSELYVGGVNSALYKGDFTWVSVSQEVRNFMKMQIGHCADFFWLIF